MKEEYWYVIYLFLAVLVIFIIMTGVVFYRRFLEKKRKAFQKIDEQVRHDVDDALAFLEDETGKNLSEQKREEFKLLVITRLKKAERHNKEAIKKLIREEIKRQQTEKKEQLQRQAVKKIIRDVLTVFRMEFFRKVKKIIAQAKTGPKTKNSRIQEQRRRAAEEQQRNLAEREKQKNEQERKKETEERIKNAREKEEALEKERQEQEKERKQREEQEKKRQEEQKKQQQKQEQQKQADQAAKAAAMNNARGGGGRWFLT